jgi:TonB family protein
MELVDGQTLRRLDHDRVLPTKRVLDIGVQLAEGLAKANAEGIVHRDLKPENVMVTKDGFVRSWTSAWQDCAATGTSIKPGSARRVGVVSAITGRLVATVGGIDPGGVPQPAHTTDGKRRLRHGWFSRGRSLSEDGRRRREAMRIRSAIVILVLGLAITTVGCGAPPTAEIDAAKAAVSNAVAAGARDYAAASLKAAEEAQAALDAEVKVQEGKWFKSYDKTKELAAAATAAGEKAAAEAATAKQQAEAVAAKERADAEAKAQAAKAAVRVGGKIKAPTKTKDVPPEYPATAQQAHVSGVVIIEATIGPDGKVIDAKVLRSVPMLDQAALNAVKQWEYTPTLLNGKPVPVVVTVTVNFKLK